ncbi:MAG: hypothetical protein QM662_10700 [Gordonia sp. (in: high G+C Gram-positive bacteria)]
MLVVRLCAALRAVLLSALLVALAACSSPAPPSTSSSRPANLFEADREAGVQRLLDALSRVLVSGSAADLDVLLDPAAAPAFRQRLHTEQDNLAGTGPDHLRLSTLRYRLTPTEEAETLISDAVQARLDEQGSSDSWVAPVEIRYALGGATLPGIDEPEVTVTTQLVAARYGDDWKLLGDGSLVGEPATAAQLWDAPGLAVTDVRTAGGTSVIAHYDTASDGDRSAALTDRLQALLPGAVDAVSAFWGTRWARRAVLVTTATDEWFRVLAGAAADAHAAAAATTFAAADLDTHTATGQRVMLTPAAADLPAPTLGVVIRHELTHVAARAYTSTSAPMWLTEGVAEYVGRKNTYTRLADAAPDLAALVAANQTPATFPADSRFTVDSATSRLAYQTGWSIAAFVADRFGAAKLKSLYVGVAATGDTARQDRAIRASLGIDRATMISRWRGWLAGQVR